MSSQLRVEQRRLKQLIAGAMLGLSLILATEATGVPPARATNISEKMAMLKQTSNRWIEVNVATQRLIAWEGNMPVYAVIISSGTDEHPTVTGSFAIQSKHRTARMRGPDYDVPDVPYTMYYYGGYAIHGAYWHRRFGTPVSHGCVNVAVNHARWLYDWASVGTPVVVHF
jgi:lipoprotein-anchoring transpeptidase ErfK/SrfK